MRATLQRYGGRASPALPTATPPAPHDPALENAGIKYEIRPELDQVGPLKHHPLDPWKRTTGGRLQIGMLAGFKSESVAGFLLECVAGFVGIRIRSSLNPALRRRARCEAGR